MKSSTFFPAKFATLALTTGLLSAVSSLAQTSPAPSGATATKKEDTELVNLSPFVVSDTTDVGYIATRAAGATKTSTPMLDLPHSIQVLNSEFIADTASNSVFQAARYVSNVAGGSQRGDDALLVRGFAVTRLRNGQPYSQNNAFTFDEMAAFDRVEVIKGASAVLYGSASPGGLINLVDKRPLPKQQSTLSLMLGSFDFYKGLLDTTGPLTKLGEVDVSYRAIAGYEDSKSWRTFAFRQRTYFNGSLQFKLSRDTTVVSRMEFQKDKLKDSYGKPYIWFSTANVGTLLNIRDEFFRGEPGIDKKRVERFIWDTTIEHRISDSWNVRASLAYGDAFSTRTEVFISAQGTVINLFPRFVQLIPRDEQQWVGEADLVGKFKIGSSSHQVLAGVNFFNQKTNDSNYRYNLAPLNFDIFNPVYGNATVGSEVLTTRRVAYTESKWRSPFIQDQFGILDDRVQFIVGVRRDDLKQSVKSFVTGITTPNNQHKVSPRYGVLWKVNPEYSLYASYNESFTPASGAGSVQGVPFPSPTAKQTEFGLKFELFNKRLFGGVAVFENARRNLTTVDVLNPGFSVATGEVTSRGSELDLGVALTKDWQVIVGLGFQNATTTKDNVPANVGLEQPNVPNESGSLWTKYNFSSGPAKGLSVGLGVTRVGERAGGRDSVPRSFNIPGYTTANVLISYGFKHDKFSLNIENLTDERYIMNGQARLADPGEHRNFRLTYTRTF
ncbi:MAG: TonB-dependent siderophore receptor [Opitutus sp.]|nr:TonB-dependent siderophore receptor [Opitutus sp.]